MPQNVTQYDLLVSCPGDIKDELNIIEEVVNQFNDSYSDILQVSVRIRHWAKSAYSESGGKPQDLLNKQFVNDCDAAVALFWTRFGTPTDKYGSGTEEEIEIMLEAGKQVFLYFSDILAPPSGINKEQYDKINDFKSRYAGKGLYFPYNDIEEFRKLFSAHLTKFFLSLEAVKEVQNKKQPLLSVKSININNQVEEAILPLPFRTAIHESVDEMLSNIKSLFQKINNYPPFTISAYDLIANTFQKAVEIDDDKKEYIIAFAKATKIELSKDFFSLGGLKKDILGGAVALDFSSQLHGTTDEINKQKDILILYKKLIEIVNWTKFDDVFAKIKCIRLCVENNGTTYDEDIEVCLHFSKDMLIQPKDIPMIKPFTLEEADYSFYEIFGIPETVRYLDFDASIKQPNYSQTPSPSMPISLMLYGSGKSEEEEYRETLEEVFDYDFFEEADKVIVKLHIDYLKHNTAVAFPTVLFVTDDLKDIEYTIASKHCDNKLTGKIKVQTEIQ